MRLLNKFILLTVLSIGVLYAYTYQNGVLSAGEELIISPKDGYSFNVKRLSGSDANYDIQMSNQGKIYYADEDQIDDIYLVFHDDVMPGDRIKIHINSGRFEYSFSAVNRLPSIVKKALIKKAVKVEVEEKSYKQTHHKNRYKSKKIKKEEPIVGEFVTDNEFKNSKPIVNGTISVEEVQKEPEQQKVQAESIPVQAQSQKSTVNSSSSNEKPFSDSFYNKFTAIFQDLVKKFANENKSSANKSAKVSNTNNNKTKIAKTEKKEESFKVDKRELVHEATILRSNFDKLPTEIDLFDTKDKQDVSVKKELKPKIVEKKSPVLQKDNRPIKTYKSATNTNSDKDKFSGRVIGHKATEQSSVIDTGYKKGYEDLSLKDTSPKVDSEDKSSVEAKKDGDKIVITKILEKEKKQDSEDKFAGRVLGKSSDRVLGGGYEPSSESGSLGVRATKNSLPVSAWIEVFKNGTKSRVKTFYTSVSKIKKVKLPAGVYMIRTTYRTRDGKLQKTIKNIHIKNGEDITRNITFNDGRLKVVAKRGGKPQYVKVVVYKSGSKSRYSYDFSDRDTGVVFLTLPVGLYDIEVLDHDDKKSFTSERIEASKTDTISVEF